MHELSESTHTQACGVWQKNDTKATIQSLTEAIPQALTIEIHPAQTIQKPNYKSEQSKIQ